MRKNFVILLFSIFPAIIQTGLSQIDILHSSFGIFGHYGINFHDANFKKIPDCPSCSPGFESGYGSGISFGLLWEYPIMESISFGIRASYWNYSAKLSRSEPSTFIVNGKDVIGEFEHTLQATLASVGLEPTVGYTVFKNFNIFAGFHAGGVITKKYNQLEKIIKPEGVTFLNAQGDDSHSGIRNQFNGDLTSASKINLAGIFGVSYEVPINSSGSIKLAPEVICLYGLTKIVKSNEVNKWQANTIKAGIALKYSPITTKPIIEKFEKKENIDTIKIESDEITENRIILGLPVLRNDVNLLENTRTTTQFYNRTDTIYLKKIFKIQSRIVAVGVDRSGVEIPNPKFIIEEFVSNRLDPLLGIILFKENSSDLPIKYKTLQSNETSKFEVDSLYRETTLDINFNILNIVGKRMIENPTARITLVGCNADFGIEKNNTTLSQKRAETIGNYLIKVWNISPNRIKIEKRNLPAKASVPKDSPDNAEENRRVEIFSDNDKILEPVFIKKIDRSANPPIARFKAEADAESGIKQWQIKAYQGSNVGGGFTYKGETIIPYKVDWELEISQNNIPMFPEPIIYSLEVDDNKGFQSRVDKQTLPIEVITVQKKRAEKIGDFELERFSLILFDFNKATIEGTNKKIIDFISSRIKPESEIVINGYTDRTGDSEYNKKLSGRRAEATKRALKCQNAISEGIGEEKLIYDNDIPEGRIYSRSVEVIVKTKVK